MEIYKNINASYDQFLCYLKHFWPKHGHFSLFLAHFGLYNLYREITKIVNIHYIPSRVISDIAGTASPILKILGILEMGNIGLYYVWILRWFYPSLPYGPIRFTKFSKLIWRFIWVLCEKMKNKASQLSDSDHINPYSLQTCPGWKPKGPIKSPPSVCPSVSNGFPRKPL